MGQGEGRNGFSYNPGFQYRKICKPMHTVHSFTDIPRHRNYFNKRWFHRQFRPDMRTMEPEGYKDPVCGKGK